MWYASIMGFWGVVALSEMKAMDVNICGFLLSILGLA